MARVSRGANKNKFAIKIFHFCGMKTRQQFFVQEQISILRKETFAPLDNLRDFLKAYGQANKSSQFTL